MNILYKKSPTAAALALGSNIGCAESFFDAARKELQFNGFAVSAMAGVITTAPVDCPEGTPDFANSALIGHFSGSPEELLQITQMIEVKLGRPADHGFHEARTIDLDIIMFGDVLLDTPDLILPHPQAQNRLFVLEPLFEIAPDWVFPDSGRSVAEALMLLRSRTF